MGTLLNSRSALFACHENEAQFRSDVTSTCAVHLFIIEVECICQEPKLLALTKTSH